MLYVIFNIACIVVTVLMYKPQWIEFTLFREERTDLSRVMRKQTFCICENKEADQLRGYREADYRLCFRYTDSTIPLLSKSKISIL